MSQELDPEVLAAVAEAEEIFRQARSPLGKNSTYIRRFSPEARFHLEEKLNYLILEMEEISVAQMLDWNYPISIHTDLRQNMRKEFQKLPVRREVAIYKYQPFLIKSAGKGWSDHLEMILKHGAKIRQEVPDIRACMGSITDTLNIWHQARKTWYRHLPKF